MAVYGYVRVSNGRQIEEGESLDVQNRIISGYALMKNMTLDRTFREEGVSGSIPMRSRPAGAEMLAAVQPGDTIIAAKLDRAFRSSLDALETLGELKRRNISLHLIDLGGDVGADGMAKLVFTVLAAVAELERDRIRERIRDTKKDQAARGRYLGGNQPLGWVVGEDGELVEDPAGQAARRRIVELRAGGASLRRIAEILGRDGFEISHRGVAKVFERERATQSEAA